MGKCKRCGRRYAKDPKGKFPKHYFEHIKKYHPNAGKRSKKGKKGRKGGKTVNTTTGGYSKLTLTFHN